MEKSALRKIMQAKRDEKSDEERREACGYLCGQLLSMTPPQHSVIAGYKSIKKEVDISQALLGFHDKKYPLCLPTITIPERIMRFLSWKPKMETRKGPYGVLEPVGGEVMVPDIVIAPLLAFDRKGHRLGYGGGYYDATIAFLKKQKPGIRVIGIGFDFQEMEALPHEPHDMKLDMIVTNKEIITL